LRVFSLESQKGAKAEKAVASDGLLKKGDEKHHIKARKS
jgi:hypothetical protein